MEKSEKQRLLKIRKQQKKASPPFRRWESWRRAKISESWRKPRGLDNKSRKHLKIGNQSPNIGYRKPKAVRGLHPSGLVDIVVATISEIDALNPKIHGIRISARLGGKKKLNLIEYAIDKKFKIFNLGIDLGSDIEEEIDEEFDEMEEEIEEKEEEDFLGEGD